MSLIRAESGLSSGALNCFQYNNVTNASKLGSFNPQKDLNICEFLENL